MGADLQSEHERYLVEKHFGKPVILTDYPKAIKAFTCASMKTTIRFAPWTFFFPGIGEIVGGSQREKDSIADGQNGRNAHPGRREMEWFSIPADLVFVRTPALVLASKGWYSLLAGMSNIRDVILSQGSRAALNSNS